MSVSESRAREMAIELGWRFKDFESTEIRVDGWGSIWNVSVVRNAARVRVHCLDSDVPLYQSHFMRVPPSEFIDDLDRQWTVAYARQHSLAETIETIDTWLASGDLEQLYKRHPAVNREIRALVALRDVAIELLPPDTAPLDSVEFEYVQGKLESCVLTLRRGIRGCDVSFAGRNANPDARWTWDDCVLFAFPVDSIVRFAAVINAWLCCETVPSTMRLQFPWLTIGQVADDYEAGDGIAGEFAESWNTVERFYSEMNDGDCEAMLRFVRQVRSHGYERKLRAGTSLFDFVVSRCRRPSRRDAKPSIEFSPRADNFMTVMFSRRYLDSSDRLDQQPIEYSPAVELWLEELCQIPID